MPTPTVFRGSDHLQPIRLHLTVLLLVAACISGTFQRGVAQSATFEPTWYMVLDRANLLDEGQERSAINDAWRLNQRGVPTQVVTEVTQTTPEMARQRASDLLVINGIESSPGAGDGVMVYAAVNPADRSDITIAIGAGPNALPHGGLTASAMANIHATVIFPHLANGHPARAIVYSLREMIYHDIFVPPPAAPLTGWRSTVQSMLTVAGPALAIVAIAGAWRLLRPTTTFRHAFGLITAALLIALLLAVVSVAARSTLGTFSAISILAATIVLAMVADRNLRHDGQRILTATPRPPGTLAPISGQRR